MVTRAFVSYSWDDETHRNWVEHIAKRLRGDGIDVYLDRWHLHPGDDLTAFMEEQVRESDFVIMVCTPKFKLRSDSRSGGVGYEGAIITGEIFTGTPLRKFIPLLRKGEWKEASPTRILSSYYIDFKEPFRENSYSELLDTLLRRRKGAPPLGVPATGTANAQRSDPRLTQLLAEVQGRQKSLAQCIAEALPIARDRRDGELSRFCEQELAGHNQGRSVAKSDPAYPHHRAFVTYLSYAATINPSFVGWGQNPSNIFHYMDTHPDSFQKLTTLDPNPIASIESQAANVAANSFRSWESSAGAFLPNIPNPEVPVFCYARAETPRQIIEATRNQFTRLLMKLLSAS